MPKSSASTTRNWLVWLSLFVCVRLSYTQIAKQFTCSTSMVQKVARVAGLLGTRGTGRKKQAAVANV